MNNHQQRTQGIIQLYLAGILATASVIAMAWLRTPPTPLVGYLVVSPLGAAALLYADGIELIHQYKKRLCKRL